MRRRFLALAFPLLTVVSACEGGIAALPPAPTFRFADSLALVADQGSVHRLSVTVERDPGLDAWIDLSVSGLPAGVIGRFEPASLAPGEAEATLILSVSNVADSGSYRALVAAEVVGGVRRTTSFTLSVRHVPFTFTLWANRSGLALAPGMGATLRLNVAGTSSGPPSPVSLRFDGLPTGITGTLPPIDPALGTTMSLQLAPNLALGTYEVPIIGEAASGAQVRFAIPVTVSANAIDFNAPATITMTRGQTLAVDIPVLRANADGVPMSFTIEGLGEIDAVALVDQLVTPTWDANPVTTSLARLSVRVGTNVAPGGYFLTFVGSAAGFPTQRQYVVLAVQ